VLRARVLGSRVDLRRCLDDPPRSLDGRLPSRPWIDSSAAGGALGGGSAAALSMGWLDGLYAVKHHHHGSRHAAAAGATGGPAVPECVTAAAYSVANSPYLASLSTFMPGAVWRTIGRASYQLICTGARSTLLPPHKWFLPCLCFFRPRCERHDLPTAVQHRRRGCGVFVQRCSCRKAAYGALVQAPRVGFFSSRARVRQQVAAHPLRLD